jgi:hypothetical protein
MNASSVRNHDVHEGKNSLYLHMRTYTKRILLITYTNTCSLIAKCFTRFVRSQNVSPAGRGKFALGIFLRMSWSTCSIKCVSLMASAIQARCSSPESRDTCCSNPQLPQSLVFTCCAHEKGARVFNLHGLSHTHAERKTPNYGGSSPWAESLR